MKQKILIVEDDQAVHKPLKHLFESVGYAVEICRNPTSALEILRTTTPVALVLNIRSPFFSWKDVCVQVKQQLSSLPIIVLSSSMNLVDKVVLLELGVDDT